MALIVLRNSRSSPFGKLNPNCLWRAPVQTILGPLFLLFSERWQGNYSSRTANRKKENKCQRNELGNFVSCSHRSLLRPPSQQPQTQQQPIRVGVVTREASYVFDCDGFHCPLLLASPFLSFSRISFCFNVVAGIFQIKIKARPIEPAIGQEKEKKIFSREGSKKKDELVKM